MDNRIIIIALVFLFGCRSAKKSSSKESEKTKTETREEIKTIQTEKRDINRDIERVEVNDIVIFPRGEFVIQKDGTFKGEADSVKVRNNKKEAVKEEIKEDVKTDMQEKKQEKAETEKEKKEKDVTRKPSIAPYIGIGFIVLLMIAGIFWYIKKSINPFG